MYFSRGAFNRSPFNRSGEASTELSGRVQVTYGVTAKGYTSPVLLSGSAGRVYGVSVAAVQTDIPFSGSTGQIYAVKGTPIMDIVYGVAQIDTFYTASGSLRLDDSQSFSLDGLNLAPGDTVIIDTDSLDVLVNGVNNIDVFQQGGVFFQLKPGNNVIEVYSDQESNPLSLTVVYQGRWF